MASRTVELATGGAFGCGESSADGGRKGTALGDISGRTSELVGFAVSDGTGVCGDWTVVAGGISSSSSFGFRLA